MNTIVPGRKTFLIQPEPTKSKAHCRVKGERDLKFLSVKIVQIMTNKNVLVLENITLRKISSIRECLLFLSVGNQN